MGYFLISQGLGPSVIDPSDDEDWGEIGLPGVGGTGAGIILNAGSLIDQIRQGGKKGGDGGGDDGDGDDATTRTKYGVSDAASEYPANPEYVNPVPVLHLINEGFDGSMEVMMVFVIKQS